MAIAYVNTAVSTAGTGTAVSTKVLAAASHTTGNLIVVAVGFSTAAQTISSITDTAGNRYYQAPGSFLRSPANNCGDIWYAYNIKGNASNVITVNWTGTITFERCIANQYSGCSPTASVIDRGSNGTVAAATSVTSGAMITRTDNELIFAFCVAGTAAVYTAGTNFVMRGSIVQDAQTEDRIGVTATGSYTASITYSVSTELDFTTATFRGAYGLPNNYQQFKAGDGMSTGEKIR